jgi:anti-sigma factor RsiW
MSKTPPHDVDLMAFADGELDERQSRELEDDLARDTMARGKVDAVGELGDLLRGHLELSADAVPAKRFDALWREIDKGIDRQRAEASETVAAPQAADSIGVMRKIGRWFDRYRGHILTGAVSAGAVAALALLLRNPTAETRPQGGLAGTGGSAGSGLAGSGKVELVVHEPAEIEALDTPDGTGTVFNLEDEDGNTTVIWVTPDDTVEGI